MGAISFTQCVINVDIPGLERHPIYASPVVVVQNTSDNDGKTIKILFGTGDSPYYDENINTDDTRYNFFAYEDTAEKGELCDGKVTLDWQYEVQQ